MAVVISQDLIIASTSNIAVPLTHARICYQSYLESGMLSLVGGSVVTGYPLDNVLTDQTFEVFKADFSAAIIDIDLGSPRIIDYFAFLSKNVTTWDILYHDGTDYVSATNGSGNSYQANLGLFAPKTAQLWRVVLSGVPSGDNLEVTNIKLGQALAMDRPIYGGHSPANLSRATVFRPNISEGGEFLGRSITRKGFRGFYNWEHLPADWYRAKFKPFADYSRTGTFYIAWRPETFTEEVIYGWTNEDIQPSNMGIRDLMQVGLNVVGYDGN